MGPPWTAQYVPELSGERSYCPRECLLGRDVGAIIIILLWKGKLTTPQKTRLPKSWYQTESEGGILCMIANIIGIRIFACSVAA